ncbi:hypothetical protein AGMMS49928_18190 [Spirochaetia bacterium]|nr:hypothetical protein AGMMS49928_18190 [Spirochaetia bacterium]
MPFIRYTSGGFAYLTPLDNLDAVVDALLDTGYDEEFCVAWDFDPLFAARLMKAGFLLMSTALNDDEDDGDAADTAGASAEKEKTFILLPKLHLVRSALFFPELHVKRSIRHLLPRYELRVNCDFERILDRCVAIHGDDWITPPLQKILREIRLLDDAPVRPVSFALYREGELRAGEIGVVSGRVYTSYSGYYDEANAGTVQMILMVKYLEETGFAFLDLGMPLDYKDLLGARNISPRQFVELFRSAQLCYN